MTFNTAPLAVYLTFFRLALAAIPIAIVAPVARAQQSLPPAIAQPGAVTVLTVHAVGAQIYECQPDAAGKLGWQFREPIASLLVDGRTVGRHFAGPSWELADGSLVVGKVEGRAPGASADDIPWLKLEGSSGRGKFANVNVVQRINTKGGALTGACDNAGALTAVPYASDYVFLTKGRAIPLALPATKDHAQ
jgi:hypothetical protein